MSPNESTTPINVPRSGTTRPRVEQRSKPLDPAQPRVEVRHELPESERVCPHDGQALIEIGVEVSE